MGYKLTGMYIGTQKVRPTGTIYYVDFRGSDRATVESEGWTFTKRNGLTDGQISFSSAGLSITKQGANLFVSKDVDLSSANSIKLNGACYLDKWDAGRPGGIKLEIAPSGWTDFVDDTRLVLSMANANTGTSPSHRGFLIQYNHTQYSTGTALSTGEYEWYLNLDLVTGDLVCGMDNGLTLSGTLTSTYLGYLKSGNATIGTCIDSKLHIMHWFNAEVS